MDLAKDVFKYVEKIPGGHLILTSTDTVFNWARANSLWYLIFGLKCCAIEMMAAGAARFDMDRLGFMFRASPRQTDLMIVSGTVTAKMAPRIRRLWEQMAEPRYVLAMGSCSITGGAFFYDSYAAVKGVDEVIPVDVYVPGCPPRPEALIEGLMKLQAKINKESILTR